MQRRSIDLYGGCEAEVFEVCSSMILRRTRAGEFADTQSTVGLRPGGLGGADYAYEMEPED